MARDDPYAALGAPVSAQPQADPYASLGRVEPERTPAPSAPQRPSHPRPPAFTGDMRAEIERLIPGVRFNSGYRNPAHNQAVGGVPGSYHTRGQPDNPWAFDLSPPEGMSMADMHARLRASGLPFAENLNEGDHVHVAWTGGGTATPQPEPAQEADQVREYRLPSGEVVNLRGPGTPVDQAMGGVREGDIVIDGMVYRASPGRWSGAPDTPQQLRTQEVRPAEPEMPSDPEAIRALVDARIDLANSPYGFTENMGDAFTWGLQGPFNGLMNAAGQGIQNLFGETEYDALDAFNAHRQAWNERREAFARERPGQAITSSILGGIGAPGSTQLGRLVAGTQGGRGLLQSPGLLPTTARSGLLGVPVGAAVGLTTSDPGEELQDTAGGGALGGALGAATPVALNAAGGAARRVMGATSDTVDQVLRSIRGVDVSEAAPARADPNWLERLTGLPTPAERGASRGQEYVADLINWSNVTPDQLRAAPDTITAAEAVGPNAIAQAGALSRRAGQTPQLAEDVMSLRAFSRPERMIERIGEATGVDPAAARDGVEALIEAGRVRANPLFEAVRSQDAPVMTDRLREIMNRPEGQRVLERVYRDLANQGIDPMSVGLRAPPPDVQGPFTIEAPNARTWDLFRQTIGQMVERNPLTGRVVPSSQSPGNFGLNTISRDLTEELRRTVPGLGAALDASGDYLSVNSAFERAGGLLTRPSRDFSRVWGSLRTDAERQAAQARLLSDINDMARAGRLRPSMFRTSRDLGDNLRTAFGEERAGQIIEEMAGRGAGSEARMMAAESRMRPNLNSVTGDMIENQEQTGGLLAGGIRAGAQALQGRPGQAGQTLMGLLYSPVRGARTPLPIEARDEAGRLLYGPPQGLADLLERISDIPRRRWSGLLAPNVSRSAPAY